MGCEPRSDQFKTEQTGRKGLGHLKRSNSYRITSLLSSSDIIQKKKKKNHDNLRFNELPETSASHLHIGKAVLQPSTTTRLYESKAAQTKHRCGTLVNCYSKISEKIVVKNEKGKSKALGPSSASVGHPDTLKNTNVINEEGKAKALDLSIFQVLRVLQAFRTFIFAQ